MRRTKQKSDGGVESRGSLRQGGAVGSSAGIWSIGGSGGSGGTDAGSSSSSGCRAWKPPASSSAPKQKRALPDFFRKHGAAPSKPKPPPSSSSLSTSQQALRSRSRSRSRSPSPSVTPPRSSSPPASIPNLAKSSSRSSLSGPVWSWRADDKWVSYDASTTKTLEKAYGRWRQESGSAVVRSCLLACMGGVNARASGRVRHTAMSRWRWLTGPASWTSNK